MLPRGLLRNFTAPRLRLSLALVFLALAVPTTALIWQANGQLKWEAFYQYRGLAEELTARIDTDLIDAVNAAEGRGFGDYAFLVVSGDPAANLVQRSPLSEFPVVQDLPGVIGYFQVDADGTFSTPLMPVSAAEAGRLGLSTAELEERKKLADRMQRVLANNLLIRERPAIESRSMLADSVPAERPRRDRNDAAEESAQFEVDQDDAGVAVPAAADRPASEAEPLRQRTKRSDGYSQQVFDQLNSSAPVASAGILSSEDRDNESDARASQNTLGKVADLKLDASLQKKSETLERKSAADEILPQKEGARLNAPGRSRRLEQSALPAAVRPAAPEPAGESPGTTGLGSSRITTFASEIDPYEFSLLDSGHLVLYRKVWRNGERLIQGLLLDTGAFIRQAIEREFTATSLSGMSDLVVGYQDDVIQVIRGGQSSLYPASSEDLQGTLLYRSRLSAPLDRLDLIFSINRLPPGPGAGVLLWTTVVIGIVFLGGFLALYRLGLGQIRLARQQQDFVAAVSHELKTPLTSIRMYGEMLKEGWVSDEKRKQYYEFIHDESERLTRLISNVLQLARITRSEPRFDLKPKSVGELMNQVESKIGSQVERAGFRLGIERSEQTDHAVIRIDEDCFSQIIINLVDNAIKFSKHADTKAIEIGSQKSGGRNVTITIRDFGPGIARGQMKKIFQLFYRTESELTRETVGTGIGLAIVHQLTVAMNGTVDVVNKDPGAEFRLTFPTD